MRTVPEAFACPQANRMAKQRTSHEAETVARTERRAGAIPTDGHGPCPLRWLLCAGDGTAKFSAQALATGAARLLRNGRAPRPGAGDARGDLERGPLRPHRRLALRL